MMRVCSGRGVGGKATKAQFWNFIKCEFFIKLAQIIVCCMHALLARKCGGPSKDATRSERAPSIRDGGR
jgi:hypothetical protein